MIRYSEMLLQACAVLASGMLSVAGQTRPIVPAIPTTQTHPSAYNGVQDVGVALPSQAVGPDDLISIMVSDCPELSRSFRISSDGTLALPLLGHRVPAAGMTPVQMEDEIVNELVKAEILVRPVVSVSVAEYRSRPVSVVGAVRLPLTFQAMGETTLLDAIARAGGLAADAGQEILVSRKSTANGEPSVQRIQVKALMNADPFVNIRLHGGEEVRVPEIGKIFVTGNVKMPGAYPMQDNSETTLLKALALSQGMLPYTQKLAYIYRKDPATNQRTEIMVELNQIITRKSPDVQVFADDIIYIPENKGRKLAGSALDRIAGTGSSVASALVYRR
jgi:polysaccharide export outer membrane protein